MKKRRGWIGKRRAYRVIAERALGRPLPAGAAVHHHTETQLVICQDHEYHMLLERRTRAYRATGHPEWERCFYCKQYDAPENLQCYSRRIDGVRIMVRHAACANQYWMNWYLNTAAGRRRAEREANA